MKYSQHNDVNLGQCSKKSHCRRISVGQRLVDKCEVTIPVLPAVPRVNISRRPLNFQVVGYSDGLQPVKSYFAAPMESKCPFDIMPVYCLFQSM